MPRSTVPVTRWTMNGTVSPRSVVVVLDVARRVRRVVGHELVRRVAVQQLDPRRRVALRVDAAPSGGLDAFGLQAYGVTCGPEKIGPPIGWLVIVIRLPRAARVAHGEHVLAHLQAGDEPFEAAVRTHARTRWSRRCRRRRTVAGPRDPSRRRARHRPRSRSARFDSTSSDCTPPACALPAPSPCDQQHGRPRTRRPTMALSSPQMTGGLRLRFRRILLVSSTVAACPRSRTSSVRTSAT